MKFAQDLFPKGTFPDQQTDGAYIDETLAMNLDIYAKKIANDMHFLILITGNDSVGNGKSTLASQVATYLTWRVNQLHGTNNTFNAKNMFFNSTKLMKESPDHPPLSVEVLDEGDDLTTHGMKALAVRLKRYFRKCRQLNQIVILILPSFFELPKFYALARSHCLINVKFGGEFERGYFDFYGPHSKKLLYLRGKKEWDYDAQGNDFKGVFSQSYMFLTDDLKREIERYRKRKYADLKDDAEEKIEEADKKKFTREIACELHAKMPEIQVSRWAEAFGVSQSTLFKWYSDEKHSQEGVLEDSGSMPPKLY